MAKNASGAAFISSKKRHEEHMLARESGLELDDYARGQDVLQLQHHHLLSCLEQTTVSVPPCMTPLSRPLIYTLPFNTSSHEWCFRYQHGPLL